MPWAESSWMGSTMEDDPIPGLLFQQVYFRDSTAVRMASAARSISSSVVNRPTEKRIVPLAYSAGTCMAFRTLDTWTPSLWQAAPGEAATSVILERIAPAVSPLKPALQVLGRRISG